MIPVLAPVANAQRGHIEVIEKPRVDRFGLEPEPFPPEALASAPLTALMSPVSRLEGTPMPP